MWRLTGQLKQFTVGEKNPLTTHWWFSAFSPVGEELWSRSRVTQNIFTENIFTIIFTLYPDQAGSLSGIWGTQVFSLTFLRIREAPKRIISGDCGWEGPEKNENIWKVVEDFCSSLKLWWLSGAVGGWCRVEGNVLSADLATTFTPVNSPPGEEMEEQENIYLNREIGLYNVCTIMDMMSVEKVREKG